jgi:hypothetical protein
MWLKRIVAHASLAMRKFAIFCELHFAFLDHGLIAQSMGYWRLQRH